MSEMRTTQLLLRRQSDKVGEANASLFFSSRSEVDQAALRRRELDAQLHVPQVQRIALQSEHTVKSTEPK
jgi:hypothetical protein